MENICREWIQQEDGSVVRVDHYWHKVLQLKTPLGKRKFDVLAKTVKCPLSHMGMQTMKEVCQPENSHQRKIQSFNYNFKWFES